MCRVEYDKELEKLEDIIQEMESLINIILKNKGDIEYEELQLLSLKHEKELREKYIKAQYGK